MHDEFRGVRPDYGQEYESGDRQHAATGGDAESEWQSLAAQWICPEWLRDAKFGIWICYGPQSLPRLGGGWYSKHMYMPDVVRYTRSKDGKNLYAIVFGKPTQPDYRLATGCIPVKRISVLGDPRCPSWKQDKEGIRLTLPQALPFAHANVFKVEVNRL
jgi:hypothetical protein